jgi:hypothetical protein
VVPLNGSTTSTPATSTTVASPPTDVIVTTTSPAPVPANVVVVSTGFSQQSSAAGTEVDYGVVLGNASTSDARDVLVTVRARGAQNTVLGTDDAIVATIPAGATYYAGGRLSYQGGGATARLETSVQVSESVASAGVPPSPANVRVEPSTLGGVVVLGEVENAAATPLSRLARITAVLYDAHGKVVGGGFGYPAADVPPGARIGFTVFAPAVPAAGPLSAQVSIEPDYDPASPASSLLSVLDKGFSEAPSSTTRECDYGVVLRNLSPDRDVRDVRVTVNAVDAQNVVIGSESTSLTRIAAGSTYYFGGWLFHSLSQATTALEVFADARASVPKAAVEPLPGNVRLEPVKGGVRVLGDFTNVASTPLSALSAITAVVFDAAGNVVGGGLALPDEDIGPGATAGFQVYALSVPAARAATARVSVEPNNR